MMKKLVLTTVLLAACSLTVSANRLSQDGGGSVDVTDIQVVRADNNAVDIAFRLEVGSEVTARNRSLIIRPVLQGVGGMRELPPIIIRGRRARVAIEDRAMSAVGIDAADQYVTSNGSSVDYRVSIPWQQWMRGAMLVFNGLNTGNDHVTEVNIGMVSDNLLLGPVMSPIQTPSSAMSETRIVGVQDQGAVVQRTISQTPAYQYYTAATVGDELAARFTFVEPIARYDAALNTSDAFAAFDYNMPLHFGSSTMRESNEIDRFIEMTRQGAVRIEFGVGSHEVNRSMGENYKMLVDLISTIRVLLNANPPSSRIARVVVVGFSAPEGNDEIETLAMERAEAARDFLTANSKIDPALISIYNGSVDWATLRVLVSESSMAEKYKVLEIIDNIPDWGSTQTDDRMTHLMELENGRIFNYMRETFFPQLRQTGAYVKVYYENMQ